MRAKRVSVRCGPGSNGSRSMCGRASPPAGRRTPAREPGGEDQATYSGNAAVCLIGPTRGGTVELSDCDVLIDPGPWGVDVVTPGGVSFINALSVGVILAATGCSQPPRTFGDQCLNDADCGPFAHRTWPPLPRRRWSPVLREPHPE